MTPTELADALDAIAADDSLDLLNLAVHLTNASHALRQLGRVEEQLRKALALNVSLVVYALESMTPEDRAAALEEMNGDGLIDLFRAALRAE